MYKIAIIGAGSAGIAAAQRALRYGYKTVVLEESLWGGVCLNRGCIPTKLYLRILEERKESKVTLSFLWEEKENLIAKLRKNSQEYLKKKGIDIVSGHAHIEKEGVIKVQNNLIEAENIIVATGSRAKKFSLPFENIVWGEEFLSLKEAGKKILIIGAGAMGIEFATILRGLGREVTIVEKEASILPAWEKDLTKRLEAILKKQGISIKCDCDVSNLEDDFGTVIVTAGRKRNLDSLGLEKLGIKREYLGANFKPQKGLYLVGDARGEYFLAYTAEREAELAVDDIAGKETRIDFNCFPQVVFSQPQLAWVGWKEEEARKKCEIEVIRRNFLFNYSSYVYSDEQAYAKIVIDKRNEYILGGGIISNIASELINIVYLAIKNKIKYGEWEKLLFPHPSRSEILAKLRG